MAGKTNSYLAIAAITILTIVIGFLLHYLLITRESTLEIDGQRQEQQSRKVEEKLHRQKQEFEEKLKEYNKWKRTMKVVSEDGVVGKRKEFSVDQLTELIQQNNAISIDRLSLRLGLSIPRTLEALKGLSGLVWTGPLVSFK